MRANIRSTRLIGIRPGVPNGVTLAAMINAIFCKEQALVTARVLDDLRCTAILAVHMILFFRIEIVPRMPIPVLFNSVPGNRLNHVAAIVTYKTPAGIGNGIDMIRLVQLYRIRIFAFRIDPEVLVLTGRSRPRRLQNRHVEALGHLNFFRCFRRLCGNLRGLLRRDFLGDRRNFLDRFLRGNDGLFFFDNRLRKGRFRNGRFRNECFLRQRRDGNAGNEQAQQHHSQQCFLQHLLHDVSSFGEFSFITMIHINMLFPILQWISDTANCVFP